ncbi:PREDICTED: bone morphogenetic protein 2-like [Dinoponera quadriceps]|uniref:Bone morphogenetic protein 2-like n=1 Tax=Dinoponera quadriceps TaxID=609295 RepID=A0A6P3X9I8_DINQU|nr:PREDICTED: bone morphogenetic protein 2-like [Dinoponera quadriceps]
MRSSGCWLLLATVVLCAFHFWKTGSISRWSSSMHAKALIHFDLSIPSSAAPRRPFFDSARRRQRRNTLSKYMLQLYHRRPETDIVRAIRPVHISGPLSDGGRILEFAIPSVNAGQSLETAELLGIAGAIVRVRSFRDATARNVSGILRSRKDDSWRAFNVTPAVVGRSDDTVKLYVHGTLTYRPYGDGPILLLNYSKTDRARRQRRSVRMDQERDQEDERRAKGSVARRRRRDVCRRRPLYVDFALISYDRWVIAPPGYEAYQCTGKCFLPFADHLNPTKHAIVQTLMHGALQNLQANGDSDANKVVSRACCVPTRLEPTSLLYLDNRDAVTYEYDYEDMVVVECGCR